MVENIVGLIPRQLGMYIAEGTYCLLYLFSWFIIIKNNDHKGKNYFVKPMLVISIIVFNPLIAVVLEKCLQSAYWRTFWLFQEGIVISYGFILLLRKSEKMKKAIVTLIAIVLICLSGRNLYTTGELSSYENLYKIPQEMIEICEIVSSNEENAIVTAVEPIPIWVRQYDASIKLIYGRYKENELRAAVNSDSRDYTYLYDELTARGCNVFIIESEEISVEKMLEYGFEYIGETENYMVFRVIKI